MDWSGYCLVRSGGSGEIRWSGTGLATLREVRDGLWNPWGGPGRVGGPLGISGTGCGTLGEFRDG